MIDLVGVNVHKFLSECVYPNGVPVTLVDKEIDYVNDITEIGNVIHGDVAVNVITTKIEESGVVTCVIKYGDSYYSFVYRYFSWAGAYYGSSYFEKVFPKLFRLKLTTTKMVRMSLI